jgi:endonuclease-3
MAEQTSSQDSKDDFARRQAKYAPVARLLDDVYGVPDWRTGTPPMDELVSCIISQSTTDSNTERAFGSLKERFPTWEAVAEAPADAVIDAIRSGGLANQKGPRIQEVLRLIYAERGAYNIDFLADMPVDEARAWLTKLPGVGPKTAAIVLCFAFERPAFPVDTHVHRVSGRIGFLPPGVNAVKAHPIMEAIVPPEDYFKFHIHLIQHGRTICRARNPLCEQCPIAQHCDYYSGRTADEHE